MPIQSFSEFNGIGSPVCSPMESARSSRALRRQNAISQKALQEKFLIQPDGDGTFECMFCNESYKHHEQLGKHLLARHRPTLCEPSVLCVEAEYLGPREKRRVSAAVPVKEEDQAGSDCEVCGQTFIDSSDLVTHMKKHKDSFAYACNICGRRFKERWFLTNHKRFHSNRTGGKNKQAVTETPATINEIVQEPVDHNVASVYKLCAVCGFIFPNKESLVDHSKIHRKGLQLDTSEESKTREEPENVSKEDFMSFLNLKPAKPPSEKPEPTHTWIGELDPFNTYQAWQLATTGKVALISDSGKESSRAKLLMGSNKNEITDTGNTEKMSQSESDEMMDTAKDDNCEEAAPSQEPEEPKPELEEEPKVQSEPVKAPTCPDCGKQLKTYLGLLLHSRVHLKGRRDSESSAMSSVEGQLPTNSPDTPAEADTPARAEDQVTIKIEYVSEPENVGGNAPVREKPVRRGAVKRQAVTKPKAPPSSRECSFCGKRFRSNYYLNIHLRMHTGEKPYKCDFCEYAAAQKTSLRYHLERHHLFKPGESNARVKSISKSLKLLKRTPDFPLNIQQSKTSEEPISDAKEDPPLSKPPKKTSALRNKRQNSKQGEKTAAVKRKREMSAPEQQWATMPMEESLLTIKVKLEPEECPKVEQSSQKSKILAPCTREDLKPVPMDLCIKPARDVSATLPNGALLAVHSCANCTYKTLYPEVLTIHQKLVHRPIYDPHKNNKGKNPGLVLKARRTGCPPTLQGVDVAPLQLNSTRLTKASPPTNAKILSLEKPKRAPSRSNRAAKSENDSKRVEQENKLQSAQQVSSQRYLQPDLQGINHLLERMQHPEQKRPPWTSTPNPQTGTGGMTGSTHPYHMMPPLFARPTHLETGEPFPKRANPGMSASSSNFTNAEVMKILHQSQGNMHHVERQSPSILASNLPYPYEANPRWGQLNPYEQLPSGTSFVGNHSLNQGSTASPEVKQNSLYRHLSNRGFGPSEKRP